MIAVFDRKPVRRGRATRYEKMHEFLERDGRPGAAQIRDWIEHWFSQLPSSKQPDIRGRLRSDDILQYTSAYFELQMFAMLRTMGYEVGVEPALAGGRYIPDFLVRREDEKFYLEATVCGQDAGELRATSNEKDAVEKIRSALKETEVELHSHIWLEAEGDLNQTLSKKEVAQPFVELLRGFTAEEVQRSYRLNPDGHRHRTEFGAVLECDGWTLHGVLEPKFHEDAPFHVWGPARTALGDATEAIRRSLTVKASRWRRMGPASGILVVAIAVCHSQFFWNDGDGMRAISERWSSDNLTAPWRDEFNVITGILFVENVSLGNEQVTRTRLVANPARSLPESLTPLLMESRLATLTGTNEGAAWGEHR